MCVALPLVAVMTGCPTDPPGSGDENDEDTGISSLGTDTTTTDSESTETAETTDETDETADTDSTTAPDCGDVSIEPTYVPPNVMFVVDASGSMVYNEWDHDQDPNTPVVTRWNTLHSVVDNVTSTFGPAMNAGIQRFPSSNAQVAYGEPACAVNATPEVELALDNAAAIMAGIPGPNVDDTEVKGGTPATAGINSAVSHLTSQGEEVPRYIVLVTDGAANCTAGSMTNSEWMEVYDENLEPTVESALSNDSITTFVVGIDIQDATSPQQADGTPDNTNPYERLNDLAIAGGAPKNMGMDPEKFFNSTNQQELLDAIEAILGDVTSCTIDLTMTEEGPPDPSQIPYVTFESNGMTVPFLEDPADCDTMDGWTWVEEGLIVTFCGSYCEDFTSGTASFDGTYGCPPPG